MEGVDQVEQLNDTTLRWTADVAGRTKSWEAKITEQRPDQVIAWKSIGGAPNDGVVTFQPLDGEHTRVRLALDVDPQGAIEFDRRCARLRQASSRGRPAAFQGLRRASRLRERRLATIGLGWRRAGEHSVAARDVDLGRDVPPAPWLRRLERPRPRAGRVVVFDPGAQPARRRADRKPRVPTLTGASVGTVAPGAGPGRTQAGSRQASGARRGTRRGGVDRKRAIRPGPHRRSLRPGCGARTVASRSSASSRSRPAGSSIRRAGRSPASTSKPSTISPPRPGSGHATGIGWPTRTSRTARCDETASRGGRTGRAC